MFLIRSRDTKLKQAHPSSVTARTDHLTLFLASAVMNAWDWQDKLMVRRLLEDILTPGNVGATNGRDYSNLVFVSLDLLG